MIKYIIVYRDLLNRELTGGLFTKTVGPFETIEAAQVWFDKNTPDSEGAGIDTVLVP